MTAFDTDIFTEIMLGDAAVVERAALLLSGTSLFLSWSLKKSFVGG